MLRRIIEWARKEPIAALVSAGAIAIIVELFVVFAQRLVYPFELEWMEGGTVSHIQVLLAGERLYREPSLAFTPYLYPPVYSYLSAFVARIVGVSLFAPRFVSVCSTIGSMVLAARLVRGEGGRPVAVLATLSFIAISFGRCGWFMDLARVDSLFVVVILLATYLLRHGKAPWTAVAAGLVFALSFFTKQTGLILSGLVIFGSFFADRRRALIAGITFAVVSGVAFLIIDRATDGWFRYYAFTVPKSHPLRLLEWWPYFKAASWEPLPLVFVLALTGFVTGPFEKHRVWTFAALVGGSFLGGYTSLMKQDGFINGIMPFLVTMAIVAGLGVEAILRAAAEKRRWRELGLGVVILQWFMAYASPKDQIPRKRDRVAGEQMLARLRERPGPVLAFNSNYYATMAGHPEITAHTMALMDVIHMNDAARNEKLVTEMRTAIASGKYPTIVTDDTLRWLPPEVMAAIQQSYRETQPPPFDAANTTFTRTGVVTRPKTIWTRR